MPAKKKEKKEEEKKKPAEKKAEIPAAVLDIPAAEPVPAETPAVEAGEEGSFEFSIPKSDRYFEAIGRRKTSVARVRLHTKGDLVTLVNERDWQEYFPTAELQKIVQDPMRRMRSEGRFRITVKVKGGGIHSQAEAVRMGMARALTIFNPEFRKRLKKAGFLSRDSRMVERKKFGLKKARRAPQWQKR